MFWIQKSPVDFLNPEGSFYFAQSLFHNEPRYPQALYRRGCIWEHHLLRKGWTKFNKSWTVKLYSTNWLTTPTSFRNTTTALFIPEADIMFCAPISQILFLGSCSLFISFLFDISLDYLYGWCVYLVLVWDWCVFSTALRALICVSICSAFHRRVPWGIYLGCFQKVRAPH